MNNATSRNGFLATAHYYQSRENTFHLSGIWGMLRRGIAFIARSPGYRFEAMITSFFCLDIFYMSSYSTSYTAVMQVICQRRQDMKNELGLWINHPRDAFSLSKISALIPRLWMVMLVLAIPFLIVTSRFFEAWEGSGERWAFLADMLLPALNIAYVAMIVVLKRKKI